MRFVPDLIFFFVLMLVSSHLNITKLSGLNLTLCTFIYRLEGIGPKNIRPIQSIQSSSQLK